MAIPAAPAAQATLQRLSFVDLLRGWAVIVMIQTHVLNASLAETLRVGWFYHAITFIDGLVAPSFIFASGFVFALSAGRRRRAGRRFLRLTGILALGYLMHLPLFSLRGLLEADASVWRPFWCVDVLQCIAVTLIALQVVGMLVKDDRRLFAIAALCGAGVLLTTPLAWGLDVRALLPAPLAAYVNGRACSLFPLFPWSSFLLFGAVAGHLYVRASSADGVRRYMRSVVVAGIGVIVLSFLVEPLAARAYPWYDYWSASPSFVLLRTGLVLLLMAGLYRYEQRRGVSPSSIVTLIGRESLLVYAAHLMLLYGDVGPFNFRRWAAGSFGYAEVLAVTLLLLGLMTALALGWSALKRGPEGRKRLVQGLVAAGFVAGFVLTP